MVDKFDQQEYIMRSVNLILKLFHLNLMKSNKYLLVNSNDIKEIFTLIMKMMISKIMIKRLIKNFKERKQHQLIVMLSLEFITKISFNLWIK